MSFEEDPTHFEKMFKDMRLADSKPNMIPGAWEDRSE